MGNSLFLSIEILRILVSKYRNQSSLFSIPGGISSFRFVIFSPMFKINFLSSFSLTGRILNWHSSLCKENIFLMLGWSSKVSIISGRLAVVVMILDFRSEELVILKKCLLKISDIFYHQKICSRFQKSLFLLFFWNYYLGQSSMVRKYAVVFWSHYFHYFYETIISERHL